MKAKPHLAFDLVKLEFFIFATQIESRCLSLHPHVWLWHNKIQTESFQSHSLRLVKHKVIYLLSLRPCFESLFLFLVLTVQLFLQWHLQCIIHFSHRSLGLLSPTNLKCAF